MKSLHVAANGGDMAENCGIPAVEADDTVLMDGIDEVGGEIWLDDHGEDHHNHGHGHGHHEDDDLIVHHDPSIFYGDLPTLPDFPCMSSSSSSSTSPAHVNAILSSASSSSAASSSTSLATSWTILRSDGEDPPQNQNQYGSGKCDVKSSPALQSTASMEIPLDNSSQGFGCGDCTDILETFGYMDLLDSNEFFDTSAIFFSQDDDTQNLMEQTLERQEEVVVPNMVNNNSGGDMQIMGQEDDLATVFLEWLKNNKETISAEDLRKVKIKKATIESAAKRLGGGKEAMKQLLKLILEWVQTNHLQRRRTSSSNLSYQQDPFQNSNPHNNNNNLIQPSDQTCFSPSTWVPPPLATQPAFVSDSGFGYMPAPNYPPREYFPLVESPLSCPQPPQSGPMTHQQVPMPNSQYSPFQDPGSGFAGYDMNQCQYPFVPSGQVRDPRLLRLCSSATKEARKKRMARQRRFFSHHHRHSNNTSSQTQNGESCVAVASHLNPVTGGTWMYWPNVPTVPPPVSAHLPAMETQLPIMDRAGSAMPSQQVVPDRPQGWKSEKNLRFLLQKVLKQSDVGSLGRIVLPKKEAETHLPELEARDGISLAMEDIGTSRVWNLRYRFWPNNKSRMYLLENTGDFVKTNGLQEGDFIVIYSDVKCGKYLIRGVKVRQPAGQKPETPPSSVAATKRQSKSQRSIKNNSPSANMVASQFTNISSSSMKKI